MIDELRQNDIIQITDESHGWYPSLLIVDEVKPWDVVAYVLLPQSNDGSIPVGAAFNRLANGSFEKVGESKIIRH